MSQPVPALFEFHEDPLEAATPAMAQYLELKNANPDCLLFYRMGDFYEMFFEDAETASRALGIALTKRGKHKGGDIPMAGVPVAAADDYLQKLIALGHRVAVCEQMEDPAEAKKRGAKAVVRRDVVRLVTPGTVTEEKLLEGLNSSYLLGLCRTGRDGSMEYGLARLDLSTGEFILSETSLETLHNDIARIGPKEILLSDSLFDDKAIRLALEKTAPLTPLASVLADSSSAERRLTDFFNVSTLDSYGRFSRTELAAAGLVFSYIDRTQKGAKPLLSPPRREQRGMFLDIDPAARINLELTQTLQGSRQGSVLSYIDATLTSGGSRLLSQHLCAPLTDGAAIEKRLDAIEFYKKEANLRRSIRETLKQIPDMVRALSRLSLQRGGPRDLGQIRDGLKGAQSLCRFLKTRELSALPLIAQAVAHLAALPFELHDELDKALCEELPLFKRDGNFIAAGYHSGLDEQREFRDHAQKLIVKLQQDYISKTGIKTLKIKHNNILGYFIEVTAQFVERMRAAPLSETFLHRQTLATQARFSTQELNEVQARIFGAAEKAQALEEEIFEALREKILDAERVLQNACASIAIIDVSTALAERAASLNWSRPRVDNSLAFRIEGGRHLVVEAALRDAKQSAFIANNCDLSANAGETAGAIWLLTGPNMAGKSTFLRQNALLAVMAQMGSFVPAKSAHIGVIDKLYSRVGAADDLARGRSTFMVEMVETAAILNQATERSLVILDEIGRGTATFDGLSIAWASVEHLHEVSKCRALFATHFHELTALEGRLSRLKNMSMQVKEWQSELVFLHKIGNGVADGSYGLQVAKLAGLPASVLARAADVLQELEMNDRTPKSAALGQKLATYMIKPRLEREDPFRDILKALDPDALSPREALEALYKLKLASSVDDACIEPFTS